MTKYDSLLEAYSQARLAADKAQAHLDHCAKVLLDHMARDQRKTIHMNRDGFVYQATYVRNTRVKVDEAGLRKALGAKVYDKYTKRVLDRKKLESALDSDIPAMKVAPYITTELSEPFVKFTWKEDREG